MKKLRVIASKLVDDSFDVTQRLQIKTWWGWKTIDTEKVPRSCVMQHNCLGSTDWKSKWNGMPNVIWTDKNRNKR